MSSTTKEETKAVIRQRIDAFNEQDRMRFVECFSSDVSPYNQEFDEFVETEFSFFEAFPDLQINVQNLFAEGELGAVRWTFTGTHKQQGGPEWLRIVEPTNSKVEVPGIDVIRVRDGKIVEYNGEWDYGRLWDQLGLISLAWLAPM
jgi:predicted ester cyclase